MFGAFASKYVVASDWTRTVPTTLEAFREVATTVPEGSLSP
jgi:hypothetical protein